MKYDLDEIISRKGTNSVKWEFMPMGDDSVKSELLPLWIADMDFRCAQPILNALKRRVEHGIFGYSMSATDQYFAAVTGWFKKRFDWSIDKKTISVAPGVVPAIGILVRVLTKEGEGVIVQNPVYYPFFNMIRYNNREIINNPLKLENGEYSIDFDDLEEKARKPENTMFIFCSPHNPVGRVWTKEEIEGVAEICLRNNITIISDEIHCDLLRKNVRHIPFHTINDDERIVACTAISKTFNLAGIQISNIIINNQGFKKKWDVEIIDKLGLFGSNPFGIVATHAAYNESEEWLKQVNSYIDNNLVFVKDFLDKHLPKARYSIPEGTYFTWIDFREYGYTAEQLEELMVYRAKVALDEGHIFGDEGKGFERINVACPQSILESCLTRMKEALKREKRGQP